MDRCSANSLSFIFAIRKTNVHDHKLSKQTEAFGFYLLCFTGKANSTGDTSSDLKTWLSAALVNQDTCSDGFEGTNSIVKGLITGGLNQVTSLVQELLTTVHHPVSKSPGRKLITSKDQFPSWVKSEDRKLLEANGIGVDAIVAADGSGNFTKVTDAVLAAPDYSMRRYVIYIKRGVYREYVEIKKKKWNLMMIGDGMNATVISGNRSFVDGWTTFHTATFGKYISSSLKAFRSWAPLFPKGKGHVWVLPLDC